MRRLILLVFGLSMALLMTFFLFMNIDRINAFLSGPPPRYVVASRDIPAFSIIARDAVRMQPVARDQEPPKGALIDTTGRDPAPVLEYVIGRASPTQIGSAAPVMIDQVLQFDLLQRTRGSQILVARAEITPGSVLDAGMFRTVFRETAQIPAGAVFGPVGERVEQILGRLPASWAKSSIPLDEPLRFAAITFDDPSTRQPGTPAPSSAPVAQIIPVQPLPSDGSMPEGTPEQILARVKATPEAVQIGTGRRATNEIQAVAGYEGPVDVFISPAWSAMKARGIEEHRRVLKGVRLRTASSEENTDTVSWIMTNPAASSRITLARRQGSIITVVPAGGTLPSEPGVAVFCGTRDLCYRGLTTEPPEDAPPAPPPVVLPELPPATGPGGLPAPIPGPAAPPGTPAPNPGNLPPLLTPQTSPAPSAPLPTAVPR